MPPSLQRFRAPLVLLGSPDHRDVSDAELAKSLAAGEGWAVTETWHRFAPMVLMLAERSLGSKPEADDLAQEVFARLFQRIHTLQDPNDLRSFIHSFAVHALKSRLRTRKLRAWIPFKNSEESSDPLTKFYGLLDRLSIRDRLVFLFQRVEYMTLEEVASALDIPVSTVERSLARTSSRLSRWIESDPAFAALSEESTRAGISVPLALRSVRRAIRH